MTDTNEELNAMGLGEHLGELRVRLIRSILSVIIIFCIAFSFAETIINFLKGPLVEVLGEGQSALHFTGPMDVLIANIKVSFLTAVVFSCPVWLYQLWKFIEPALYKNEKKYILPFVFVSTALFFAGISFCFFIILPMALDFLLKLGMEVGTPIITVADYLSVVMLLIFGFGLVFETPVILVLLSILGLVDAKFLSENRKFVLVGILVLSALLTPPDPLSQLAMGIPTYLMYEISIIVIKLLNRP